MRSLSLALAMLMLVMVASVVYAADSSDDTLILYLPFDEGDGTTAGDLSQYGNDGELNGAPEWVAGKFGDALKFNGVSDWVEVPHADILAVDTDVTAMAWINAERHEGPGGARWQGILSKGNGPRSYSFYTEIPSTGLHFSVGGSGSVSAETVALNEWQHVVAQVIGDAHKFYINGQLAGEFPGKNPPPGLADTANVLVGKTHENSRELLGLIDEVKIWNRALDEAEIVDEMNKGAATAVEPQNKLATTWGALKQR